MTMNKVSNLILIGGTGRNAGKTSLAAALITRLRAAGLRVCAAKAVTVAQRGAICPRHSGEEGAAAIGCGACSLDTDYLITEEPAPSTAAPKTDTAKLLAAGAQRVFLLRSLKEALPLALSALLEKTGGAPLIVESNSLRTVAEPALFVMLRDENESVKPSAAAVMELAGMVINAPFAPACVEEVLLRIKCSSDIFGAPSLGGF